MPVSFYDATVPMFMQMLTALTGLINKAEAHCRAKSIQPSVLLSARLYPDMLPFTDQILFACDLAAKSSARLAHIDVPTATSTETSFEGLRQRLARTIDYLKTFKPAQFEGAETKHLTVPVGPNTQLTMTAQQFINRFALPNFFFHASIAHGILRNNGVEIGKRDFLGMA